MTLQFFFCFLVGHPVAFLSLIFTWEGGHKNEFWENEKFKPMEGRK
jgi:hypothetical protein